MTAPDRATEIAALERQVDAHLAAGRVDLADLAETRIEAIERDAWTSAADRMDALTDGRTTSPVEPAPALTLVWDRDRDEIGGRHDGSLGRGI